MYSLNQVMNGIARFIDEEILVKISGWQKWVIGAGVGVSLNKSTNIFNALKDNMYVKSLGIINEKDKIDVELLYKEFKKQSQKGPITFNVPMIGIMTLNEFDVDKIYTLIKEQI